MAIVGRLFAWVGSILLSNFERHLELFQKIHVLQEPLLLLSFTVTAF